jgi:hypothetical protein
MKIYIAGPMTGIKNWNFPAFFEAEKQINKLGYIAVNPAKNDGETIEIALEAAGSVGNPNHNWSYYMRRDLPHLLDSDAVCLLPNWKNSKGATLEVEVARAIGLPLYVLRDGKLVPRVEILGLSGWARNGKDTVADFLIDNYGYKKLSFAAPMKEALYRLNPKITINNVVNVPIQVGVDTYGWDGLKEHGPEVRRLLQRFGTEVGREMFGEDFWVNAAIDSIEDGSKVVVSDVRYPNEADAIKKLGGQVWRVVRPGFGPANDHESEHAMTDYKFDVQITNDSGLEFLYSSVKTALVS